MNLLQLDMTENRREQELKKKTYGIQKKPADPGAMLATVCRMLRGRTFKTPQTNTDLFSRSEIYKTSPPLVVDLQTRNGFMWRTMGFPAQAVESIINAVFPGRD